MIRKLRHISRGTLALALVFAAAGLVHAENAAGAAPATDGYVLSDATVVAPAAAAGESFKEQLVKSLRQINHLDADVWVELDDDYATIVKDRDMYADQISTRLEKIRQERDVALSDFVGKLDEARNNGQSASTTPGKAADGREILQIQADRNSVQHVYDLAVTALQNLYHLNDRRFTDLMQVHNERDIVEDRRMLEQRNFTALEAALKEDRAKPGNTVEVRQQLEAYEGILNAARAEAKERYHATVESLEDYRHLIDKRLASQHQDLLRNDEIMKGFQKPKRNAASIEYAMGEFNKLSQEQDNQEQVFQNNTRYIEEKLALERYKTHEMGAYATERHDLEVAYATLQAEDAKKKADLQRSLDVSGITADQRSQIRSEIAALDRLIDEHTTTYRQALRNMTARRNLAKKALDERRDYLAKRNSLRSEMTATPVSEETFMKFRNEIAKLEDKRITEEAANRKQLGDLATTVPPSFAFTPWQRGNMDMRYLRLMDRITASKEQIANLRANDTEKLNRELKAYNMMLASPNMTMEKRQNIEKEMIGVKNEIADVEKNYTESLANLEKYRQKEEAQIAERARYIGDRAEIAREIASAGTIGPVVLDKIGKLRELDEAWASRDKLFRQDRVPLTGVFMIEVAEPTPTGEVQKTSAEATTTTAAAPAASGVPAAPAPTVALAASPTASGTNNAPSTVQPESPQRPDVSSLTGKAAVPATDTLAVKSGGASQAVPERLVAPQPIPVNPAPAPTAPSAASRGQDGKDLAGKLGSLQEK